MDPALQLHPGQASLTREQEAEAKRFAEMRIAAYMSTEPLDEPETEALLCQAYQVTGLAPPLHVHWLDGPLQLAALLAPESVEASFSVSLPNSIRHRVRDYLWNGVRDKVWHHAELSGRGSVERSLWEQVGVSVGASVWNSVVLNSVGNSIRASVWDSVRPTVEAIDAEERENRLNACVWACFHADGLACRYFFDVYLAPNEAHALARFNERVPLYWLDLDAAILVRRPRVLARDAEGLLHSATGKCVEYRDGWGLYAWHGVCVPEKVILAPETLTGENFLNEQNVEVRRVIQERMGSRFVKELGGEVIDIGPRGTLYEVRLPADDPERVARYVQVQDASTSRQYFLRVPPTIQTAAEAVAWSFQLAVEAYHPSQET